MSKLIKKLGLVVGVLFLVSCSDQILIAEAPSSGFNESLESQALMVEIQEDRGALDNSLKNKRLELLQNHRKQVNKFPGNSKAKLGFRADLKVERVELLSQHVEVLKNYDYKAKIRVQKTFNNYLLSRL